MTQPRDIEHVLDQWFSDGPTVVSDRIVDVVADRIERQRQRPAWRFGWGMARRPIDVRVAIVVAALLLLGAIVGFSVIIGRMPSIVPPAPSPSPTLPATVASPKSSTHLTAAASVSPLAGSGMVVFEHLRPFLNTRLEYLASGLGEELLPDMPGTQEMPAWSADGRHLAFAASDPTQPSFNESVEETDSTGAPPRLLSTGCRPPACLGESDPGFAPDGSKVALVRWGAPTGGTPTTSIIAIRDLTSGSVRELDATRTTTADLEDRHPRWSPDGKNVTFHVVRWRADGLANDSVLYVIRGDGSGLRRLSPTDISAGDAEWSPDGSQILFSSTPLHAYWGKVPGGRDLAITHLYTIKPDGTGLRQLDANGSAAAPSWTAGGSQVLYTLVTSPSNGGISNNTPHINVMSPDGSGDRTVARFNDCCHWYPVQQPAP